MLDVRNAVNEHHVYSWRSWFGHWSITLFREQGHIRGKLGFYEGWTND